MDTAFLADITNDLLDTGTAHCRREVRLQSSFSKIKGFSLNSMN